MSNFTRTIPTFDSDHGQPPAWEEKLKDITVERDYHEAPWDPGVLASICEQSGLETLHEQRIDDVPSPETEKQIEAIRRVARRKLRGVSQQTMLLMLSCGAGPKRIAAMLRVSEDTIRRSIERGVAVVRECLNDFEWGEFPSGKGKRPTVRSALFPLDSVNEREQFQTFLNQRTIIHVSLRGDDLFREALVVYLVGKPGSRHALEK
ncbi:MAG: hypothetical protein P9L94_19475 [Candidatus Hinthialibacter antarcticus]|nr:hypothetical protein [Candidatus Hinthialibacter antarcticus]